MNIRVGKYSLTNDARQYVLSEVKISTGEKTSGDEVLSDSTFHTSLESALNALLERKIKESDATTLVELKKDFDDAVSWIKGQFIASMDAA